MTNRQTLSADRQATTDRVQIRRERNQTIVRAKVSENLQAGIGVASVVVGGAICWYTVSEWAALEQPFRVAWVAGGLGAIWFGLLSVIRFSIDEVRDLYQWLRLQEVAAGYLMQVEQLKADNLELRRELKRANAMLRTQEFEQASKGARETVTPVENKFIATRRNIEAILSRWSQGLPYGRDHVNMTEGEWKAAMDALEAAGMAGRGGNGGRQRIVVADNLNQAQQAVEKKLRTWEKYQDTNFTPA